VRGEARVEEAILVRLDDSGVPVPGSDQVVSIDAVCFNHGFLPSNGLALALGCSHQISQTEFVPEPPKHHDRDHVARILRTVQQAAAPFVKLLCAVQTAEPAIALRGALRPLLTHRNGPVLITAMVVGGPRLISRRELRGRGRQTAAGDRLPVVSYEPTGRCHAILNCLPQGWVNNTQLRDRLDNPRWVRVWASGALAGDRILDEVLTVPYELASVEPVAEDTGLADGAPEEQGRRPSATTWSRNTGPIEVACNSSGRQTASIISIDAPDHRRFGLFDDAAPG
jgi:hypothetical protein